jgi:hypothetical protein
MSRSMSGSLKRHPREGRCQLIGFAATCAGALAEIVTAVALSKSWSKRVTDDDKAKQAAVLAAIAKLPAGTTIEEWNQQRLNIIIPKKQTRH